MTINFAERYTATDCAYNFWLRPGDVPDMAVAERKGLNCVVLAHLVMKDLFGYTLPSDLRCTEMFLDSQHLTRSAHLDLSKLQQGDLLWFGVGRPDYVVDAFAPRYDETGHLLNWREFPINHVGIHTGEFINNDPLVLHSAAGENTTIWPLSSFAEIPRYQKLWGVSRLAIREAGAA